MFIILVSDNEPLKYTQMSGPWGLIRQKTQIMMCTPKYKLLKSSILESQRKTRHGVKRI